MKKVFRKIVFLACLIGLFVTIFLTIYPSFKYKQEEEEFRELVIKKDEISINSVNIDIDTSNVDTGSLILENYKELYNINNDMIGWIEIEGTIIDYPVMYSSYDEDYYLSHTFYKKYSLSGTPFVSKNYDVSNNNILIYAHNTNNRTLFGQLLKYRDKSFYYEHQYIKFDTLNEVGVYQIISVFNSKVFYEDEEVFKYYKMDYNLSEEEFKYYIYNVKNLSLYDTGVTASYGDRLITLSTCSNDYKDGRLVVVAKKIYN